MGGIFDAVNPSVYNQRGNPVPTKRDGVLNGMERVAPLELRACRAQLACMPSFKSNWVMSSIMPCPSNNDTVMGARKDGLISE